MPKWLLEKFVVFCIYKGQTITSMETDQILQQAGKTSIRKQNERKSNSVFKLEQELKSAEQNKWIQVEI